MNGRRRMLVNTPMEVKPYSDSTAKKEQVAVMFDNIAHRYDFLNHFFSAGIDRRWRSKAIAMLEKQHPATVLDIATGTADFALQYARKNTQVHITGVDISAGMLDIGKRKIAQHGWQERIRLMQGDGEQLPFGDDSFDGYTVGFGVRNFQDLEKGLKEMLRVLKPGGMGVILEFSKPTGFPVRQVFGFYFRRIMPLLGRMISKDHRAYTYLPESVDAFPSGQAFLDVMTACGYRGVHMKKVSGGIATIYTGVK
jgi:demethylmenaquinone methyltransferase/2-methoxy-6-polyprenyl-1,4-benzoquinol methylase